MREAARLARNRLTRIATPPLEARLMIYRSVTRAVHFDDLTLAKTLLVRSSFARDLPRIVEGPVPEVTLISGIEFRRQYEQLQQEVLTARLERAQAEVQEDSISFKERKRLRAYMKAERRRGKLWAPKRKNAPSPGPCGPLGRDPFLPCPHEECAQRALGPCFCAEVSPS